MNDYEEKALARETFLRQIGAVAATALVAQGHPSAALATSAVPVRLTLQRSKKQGGVPAGLLGFSFEKSKMSSGFFSATNTTLVGAFKRLGVGSLRIGGNAVDRTSWNVSGRGSSKGEVSPADVRALGAFVHATGWRVIYGINLAKNTPAEAAEEARIVANVLGSNLYGFEIGNECDQYSHNGIRPKTYALADFITEWNAYVTAIRKAVPTAVFTGPSSAGYIEEWTLPFAKQQASQIQLLTQHFYRAYGGKPTSTMALLLADPKYLPHQLELLQTATKTDGSPLGYRLDEANTFFSGGRPNVSNAYGTALWAIEFLLVNARFGSLGANFHGGSNGGYVPSYTPLADNDAAVTDVRPLYYGMLFTAQIPPGPMFDVEMSTALNVSAYGISAHDGTTYLVIINKEADTAIDASVELGATASRAQTLLLTGPSLDALTGMTLGGATIGMDGSWAPTHKADIVVTGSQLAASVPPGSAMLLKIA